MSWLPDTVGLTAGIWERKLKKVIDSPCFVCRSACRQVVILQKKVSMRKFFLASDRARYVSGAVLAVDGAAGAM